MAFIDDCLADERDQRDSAIRETLYLTRYLDGENDAAFGQLPQYVDEIYLEGYINKLKKLPKDVEGRVEHRSFTQKFDLGNAETPNPDYYDNNDF